MARLAPLPPPPAPAMATGVVVAAAGGGRGLLAPSSSSSSRSSSLVSSALSSASKRRSFRHRGGRRARSGGGGVTLAPASPSRDGGGGGSPSGSACSEANANANAAHFSSASTADMATSDSSDSHPRPPPPPPPTTDMDGASLSTPPPPPPPLRRRPSSAECYSPSSSSNSSVSVGRELPPDEGVAGDASDAGDDDDDDEWRTPGRLRRSRLLRRDREGGGASIASTFNARARLRKYYELADRILSQFRSLSDVAAASAAPAPGSLDEPYVMGHRLESFLSDVLPTHPQYSSRSDPVLVSRRTKMHSDLDEVRERLEALALRMDESERNGFILRDLEGAIVNGDVDSIASSGGRRRPSRHSSSSHPRRTSLEILDDLVETERSISPTTMASLPSSRRSVGGGSVCSRSVCSNSSSSTARRRRRVKFSDSVSVEGEDEAVPMINHEIAVPVTVKATRAAVGPSHSFSSSDEDEDEDKDEDEEDDPTRAAPPSPLSSSSGSSSPVIKQSKSDITESTATTVNTSSSTIETLTSESCEEEIEEESCVVATMPGRAAVAASAPRLPPPPAALRRGSAPSRKSRRRDSPSSSAFDARGRSFESVGSSSSYAGPVGWDVSFQGQGVAAGGAAADGVMETVESGGSGSGGGGGGDGWESFAGWGAGGCGAADAVSSFFAGEDGDADASRPDIVEAPTDERTTVDSHVALDDSKEEVDSSPLKTSLEDDEIDHEAFLHQTAMEFSEDDVCSSAGRAGEEEKGNGGDETQEVAILTAVMPSILIQAPSDESLGLDDGNDGEEREDSDDADEDEGLEGDAINFTPSLAAADETKFETETETENENYSDDPTARALAAIRDDGDDDVNDEACDTSSGAEDDDDCADSVTDSDDDSEGCVFSDECFDEDDDDDDEDGGRRRRECELSNLSFVERVQMENLVRGPSEFEEDDSDAVDSWAPSVTKGRRENDGEDEEQLYTWAANREEEQRDEPGNPGIQKHGDDDDSVTASSAQDNFDDEGDLDLFAAVSSPRAWPSTSEDDEDNEDGFAGGFEVDDEDDDDLEAEHEEFARLAQMEFQAECRQGGGSPTGPSLPDPEGFSFCVPPSSDRFDPFGNDGEDDDADAFLPSPPRRCHHPDVDKDHLSAGASTDRTDPTSGCSSGNGDSSLSESDPEEHGGQRGGNYVLSNLPGKLDRLELQLEALHHKRGVSATLPMAVSPLAAEAVTVFLTEPDEVEV